MGDLSDEELDSIERSLGGPQLVATSKSETCRMLTELRRHRAARTASAERVRAEVREAVMDAKWSDRSYYELLNERASVADAIADRVAAQLTSPPSGHVCPVPYALSPEDLDTLSELQSLAELSDWPRARAVLAQILAVHRAPGPRS